MTVEVYIVEKDKWIPGPDLPYAAYVPGEFVSHNKDLFYVGGYGRQEIYRLNDCGNGWIFVRILIFLNIDNTEEWFKMRNMDKKRESFPALVISETECYGGNNLSNV